MRIYSIKEFNNMAKTVGFKSIDFYGSFDGEKFDENSKELIMIAKK